MIEVSRSSVSNSVAARRLQETETERKNAVRVHPTIMSRRVERVRQTVRKLPAVREAREARGSQEAPGIPEAPGNQKVLKALGSQEVLENLAVEVAANRNIESPAADRRIAASMNFAKALISAAPKDCKCRALFGCYFFSIAEYLYKFSSIITIHKMPCDSKNLKLKDIAVLIKSRPKGSASNKTLISSKVSCARFLLVAAFLMLTPIAHAAER